MTDADTPPHAVRARRGRIVAAVALAALAALLAFQMIGDARASLGAALGAGLFTFAIWGVAVVRIEGTSYGRAAGVGAIATVAAFLGAAIVGGASSRIVPDNDAAVAAFFSLALVLPVMIAAAIALAALGQIRARG